MKFEDEISFLKDITKGNLTQAARINVLFDILDNVLDQGAVRARTVKFKVQKYVKSSKVNERAYALKVIASDGKGIGSIPKEDMVDKTLEEVIDWIADEIARRYVQNNIESKVEESIIEKQEKYIDEVRLSVIRKQKGSENKKTTKKYDELVKLDNKVTNKNIMSLLSTEELSEIVGH